MLYSLVMITDRSTPPLTKLDLRRTSLDDDAEQEKRRC